MVARQLQYMMNPVQQITREKEEESESPPHLSRAKLREIVDVCLLLGQLLLQNGANARRVEESVHQMGTALGADWIDIFISANALVITATSGEEFRTKGRRVVRFGGVNLGILVKLSKLTHRVREGVFSLPETRQKLAEINDTPRYYPRGVVVLLVGLACAAFSQLFGGDWATFGVTWLASSTAVFLRQELTQRQFNPFLNVILAAFLAASLSGLGFLWDASTAPTIALAASVLLLVPGVPLINAVNDMFQEYMIVGIARGVTGLLVSLSIATGLSLAISIWQIPAVWPPPFQPVSQLWLDGAWAAVAALGFAVLFNVPRHTLWGCALVGAAGHVGRYLILSFGLPGVSHIVVATFGGALIIGFLGLWFGRVWRVPVLIFTVTGIIPMVPGTYAFGTMLGVLQLVSIVQLENDVVRSVLFVNTAVDAFNTGLILGALALGTVLPGFLFHRATY